MTLRTHPDDLTRILHRRFFSRGNEAHDSKAYADRTSCNPPLLGSCPHGAGITSTPHSAPLAAVIGPGFSNPVQFNNIIRDNSAWFLTGAQGPAPLDLAGVIDLEVVGGNGATMTPRYSLLTAPYGTGANNLTDPPQFLNAVGLSFSALPLLGAPNFIGVEITTVPGDDQGNFHLTPSSPAINAGTSLSSGGFGPPNHDFDGQGRPWPLSGPMANRYDIGADEVRP